MTRNATRPAEGPSAAPAWTAELCRLLPQTRPLEPMRKHTTWRIGGPADAFVEARDTAELQAACRFARDRGLALFMLGWGSNLLVRDGGIRGVVVRLKGEFDRIARAGESGVKAGAAVRLPRLVSWCATHGLAGSEPLVGVPGTVGGALVMNAGTREGEIGPLVREVEALGEDLTVVRLPASAVHFAYRRSDLEGRVILSALLELNAGVKADIMSRVQALQSRRLRTQPVHTHNVGSVFTNPPGRFAAQLIESAGLKGSQYGGAQVSELHANFIENKRHATARDVLELIGRVRRVVTERHGVELEMEVKVVGEG